MSLSRFLRNSINKINISYKNVLEKRPILVQSIQTGLLMGSGDLIAQKFIEKNDIKNIDWIRTSQFMGIGFFIGVREENLFLIKN